MIYSGIFVFSFLYYFASCFLTTTASPLCMWQSEHLFSFLFCPEGRHRGLGPSLTSGCGSSLGVGLCRSGDLLGRFPSRVGVRSDHEGGGSICELCTLMHRRTGSQAHTQAESHAHAHLDVLSYTRTHTHLRVGFMLNKLQLELRREEQKNTHSANNNSNKQVLRL